MADQQTTLDAFVGTDHPTNTSVSSDDSASGSFETIEEIVLNLKQQTETLHHRVDTMQAMFETEQFEYDAQPIQPRTQAARDLLECMGVQPTDLTLGAFLRALNQWLIHTERVDLNDLQILMSPLLAAAFELSADLPKLPYPMILINLHKCFL